MIGYGNAPGGSDFSALKRRYYDAVAALESSQRNWAINELNALKEAFDLCKGDEEHGEQAKFYSDDIVNKLGL